MFGSVTAVFRGLRLPLDAAFRRHFHKSPLSYGRAEGTAFESFSLVLPKTCFFSPEVIMGVAGGEIAAQSFLTGITGGNRTDRREEALLK